MPPNVVTPSPRLVRVQDRLTRDSDAVWRINPRTGFLESRAGLSWTGVRQYRTPQGLLRVLRRPEQVNSPGHLKTLRRLPCCEGHPSGGVDVSAINHGDLGVGWTGDAITIEPSGGYPRPVGDVSVSRLATIAKMVDRATWDQYLADFPEAAKAGIRHDGGAPRTGTSLGYNALWYGPYVDSEIVSERDDGSLVGEWQGPRGPEQYDVEHIVDPECEVVQQLAANTGFNPAMLGGNHFAVCLAALGGRGAEQSELMRVVDSAELPITGDLARRLTRVTLQVPLMQSRAHAQVQRRTAQGWRDAVTRTFDAVGEVDPVWAKRQAEIARVLANGQTIPKCTITYGTNEHGVLETAFHFEGDAGPWSVVPAMALDQITQEYIVDFYLWSRDPHDEILASGGRQLPECTTDAAKWTVGASRDLPIVPGAWDGDKAAASVFAWAGFDGESPDPAKARQAFLIHDADAPDVRASYKLPIAEHRDGGLVAVKGGLDAAASYLPQTDAPKEVLDRARDVLDHYYAKWEEKQGAARDALPQREIKMTTKMNVEIGFGRDAQKSLAKLAPTMKVPQTLVLTLDEGPDAKALMSKLAEMQEMFGDLIEMVGTAKGEAAEMADKYDGAMTEMKDMMSVAEATKKVDEIKAALAEAEKMLAESKAAEEKAAAERDAAKQTCDALTAELAPMRAAEFKRFQDEAIARGFAAEGVKQCADAAELRRAIVVSKVGDRYAKTRDVGDAKEYVLGDDLVQAAFDGVWASAPVQSQAKPPTPTKDGNGEPQQQPSQTFGNFPRLVLQRDANNNGNEPAPTSTAAQTKAGMACLG